MKNFVISAISAVLCMAAFSVSASAALKKTVAHFVAYYDDKDTALPNPELATHLIFAPSRINADFSLKIPVEKKLSELVALKQKNPELKVTLLVGGVKSANFSEACASKKNRKKFLDILGAAMKKYGLDGIDLDWEMPTVAAEGQTGTPEDIDNYTALMREFRERFPDKVLTADIGNEAKYIDLVECAKYVDFFNVMSYDYSNIRHNSPLYLSNLTKRACVSMTIDKILRDVPPEKVSLGIPFYGRTIVNLKGKNSQIAYRSVPRYAAAKHLTPCRDEQARVPFMIDSKQQVALVYDDPISVREKCRFAKSRKLAGVSVWQALNDDDSFSLASAIADEMSK